MPWVKLTDDWYDDPALVEAGPASLILWPLLISWSARNLTDGRVPAGQIPRLLDWDGLGVDPKLAIDGLIKVGVLDDLGGAYQIVRYLDYQPSKEKVLADRDAARKRAAKSRSAKRADGVRETCAERAPHVRETCADGAPPPVPVPVDPSSSSEMFSLGLPTGLWITVAEKQMAAQQSRPGAPTIARPDAWKRKAAQIAEAEMGERARKLFEMYDLSASQLADVLLSGRTPPWVAAYRRAETAESVVAPAGAVRGVMA